MAEKYRNDNADATATPDKKSEETEKCANHPDRGGSSYDFGGVTLVLCDECAAFKDV